MNQEDMISSPNTHFRMSRGGNSVVQSHTTDDNRGGDVSDYQDPDYERVCNSGARYLRIYWYDYTSSAKCRVIPIHRVQAAFKNKESFTISITQASLGMLPIDVTVPGATGTGVYVLKPDWSSWRKGPAADHISVQGFFLEEDGSEALLCPRGILNRALKQASAAGLSFLVGFEVEFTVLEHTGDPNNKYRMVSHDGHAWSMARALATWGAKGSFSTVADEILDALHSTGIDVEQFHAEGAPGQYEIVLAPLSALKACDTLLHTRQIVESAAARHGFRVTLHPRPFASAIGNGSHAHLSITSQDGNDPKVYERFYGGILEHFPAIFAFTNSHPASYERMVDGLWAGGRWVTWGTHNKETPLRKCQGSHWEVKVMDGMANPYLAIAALLIAGTKGAAAFTWGDCPIDPAKLSSEQRKALGIEKQFPRNLEEALEALEKDDTMIESLGKVVVDRFIAIKKAEIKMLDSIPALSRNQWIMERY